MLAPDSTKKSTMDVCPFDAAKCKGVFSSISLTLINAPKFLYLNFE